jgi:hypothetical protein
MLRPMSNTAEVIKEAGKGPLSILALIVLLAAAVVRTLFGKADRAAIRLTAVGLLFAGLILAGVAIYPALHSASAQAADNQPITASAVSHTKNDLRCKPGTERPGPAVKDHLKDSQEACSRSLSHFHGTVPAADLYPCAELRCWTGDVGECTCDSVD